MSSIAQSDPTVKLDTITILCTHENCPEPIFRFGLCFAHFAGEENDRWDDHQATRHSALEALGYI